MVVALIGFMGAGKTVVGRALSSRLGYTLYDTDAMVEAEAGATIADLFAREGELAMRAREARALVAACEGDGRVVACGGGAVLAPENRAVLSRAATVVYLRARPETLRARLRDDQTRPLLAEEGAFERLLAERTPLYEETAQVIVDVDEQSADDVAVEIQERLRGA